MTKKARRLLERELWRCVVRVCICICIIPWLSGLSRGIKTKSRVRYNTGVVWSAANQPMCLVDDVVTNAWLFLGSYASKSAKRANPSHAREGAGEVDGSE
jgi:hypothetical protein